MPFPCPDCGTTTRAFDNRHVAARGVPPWFPSPATYRERFCPACDWTARTIELTIDDAARLVPA